jgi:hypothetical protein
LAISHFPLLLILLGVGLACPRSIGPTMCTEVKHAGVGRARQRCGGTSTDSRSSGMAVRRGSKPGQGILSPGDGPVLVLGSRPHERLARGQVGPATRFWPKMVLE